MLTFPSDLVQAQEVRKPDYKKNPHYKKEHRLVITHGVTGALAWVIFFPLGAILLRLLKGKTSFWLHAGIQTFSVALFTVTVGTGIAIIHGDQVSLHPSDSFGESKPEDIILMHDNSSVHTIRSLASLSSL